MSSMLEAMKKAGMVTEEQAQKAEQEERERVRFDEAQRKKQAASADQARSALKKGDLNSYVNHGADFILEGAKRMAGPPPTEN